MGKLRNYFDTNPYAENIGQATMGAVGLYGMYSNISDVIQAQKEYEYNIPTLMSANPYDRPAYSLGGAWQENANFNPEDAGKGLIGQSAISGASSGGAIGSSLGPIGGLVGAGAGAVVGAVSGLFGKKAAVRNARLAKEREYNKLKKAQSEYNVESAQYDATADYRDRYNKRLEDRRRRIQRVLG